MTELRDQAAAMGLDLQLDRPFTAEAVSIETDDAMVYVRTLAEVSFLASCTANGGEYIAALTNDSARSLASRAESTAVRSQLEDQLVQLEEAMGIEQRWTPDDPRFQVAYCPLCMGAFCKLPALISTWVLCKQGDT